jgi:glycosyltransferase involved in cell wall biosynthesis
MSFLKSDFNFSVLISVYNKENPFFLDKCIESIWVSQILKPNEIIIVCDGFLNESLMKIITKWEEIILNYKIIYLPINMGLGIALNHGLKECNYELIARMDSDDISLPNRFLKQIEFFKNNPNLVFSSSYISEFEYDYHSIYRVKKIPLSYNEILKYSKYRNPMNHMAIMFKKSYILNIGGYNNIIGYEDYDLWVRLLNNNYQCANINEILVCARIGNDMLSRRRGFRYFFNEFYLQRIFYKSNFINFYEFLRNLLLRGFSRILPTFLLKILYNNLRN